MLELLPTFVANKSMLTGPSILRPAENASDGGVSRRIWEIICKGI